MYRLHVGPPPVDRVGGTPRYERVFLYFKSNFCNNIFLCQGVFVICEGDCKKEKQKKAEMLSGASAPLGRIGGHSTVLLITMW